MKQFNLNNTKTLLSVLAVLTVITILPFLITVDKNNHSQTGTSTVASTVASSETKLSPSWEEDLLTTWQENIATSNALVDIAIYSKEYEQTYHYSNATEDTYFYTASILKPAILVELLHQKELDGTELTATEDAYALEMIENSDNNAASYLLGTTLGGYGNIQTLFDALGMKDTTANAKAWGLTTTTAKDQLLLLKTIFYPNDYLNEEHQTYIKDLMSHVEEDQQWGISAGSPNFEIKNGWLEMDDVKWSVNSIGHIYQENEDYVIAVLTNGNETMEDGEAVIETLATKGAELLFTTETTTSSS